MRFKSKEQQAAVMSGYARDPVKGAKMAGKVKVTRPFKKRLVQEIGPYPARTNAEMRFWSYRPDSSLGKKYDAEIVKEDDGFYVKVYTKPKR